MNKHLQKHSNFFFFFLDYHRRETNIITVVSSSSPASLTTDTVRKQLFRHTVLEDAKAK